MTTTEIHPQLLDPFEFHGYPASCIAGLGGSVASPDPTYAFHTHYVPVARGHAHFTLRFVDLQARNGTLWLRIHMLPNTPGATARMVTSHRIQLNWLAHHGGETQLRFEAFRGASYAIMGLVTDQSDARATDLTITLDRPAPAEQIGAESGPPEAQSTAYGSGAIRGGAMLLSLDPPSFAQPVSQPCTAPQLKEAAFRKRFAQRDEMGEDGERWQRGYVLQALERYGMLAAGARGLALGDPGPQVAQAIAAAGAACRIARLDAAAGADQSGAAIDPASLPGELFAFDFLLSFRATDALADRNAALAMIESAMECLRPGGVSVHIVAFHHAPESLPFVAFDRNGIERIALALISRGHQVARVKPSLSHKLVSDPRTGAVPFALIARRATSIL